MTVLRRTIEVSKSPAEVFDFVGDFSNTAAWDPGVETAVRTTEGPIRVGTAYDLHVRFNDRILPMTYTVTAWEPGRRVVLEGEGSTVRATDEIIVEADGSGARVRYMADLRLRGVLRVLEPLMRSRFDKLADDAMAGMRRALA